MWYVVRCKRVPVGRAVLIPSSLSDVMKTEMRYDLPCQRTYNKQVVECQHGVSTGVSKFRVWVNKFDYIRYRLVP